MKKYFLFIMLSPAIPFTQGIAQTNTFPSSGNVGIGTVSPAVPLSFGNNLSNTKLALWESSEIRYGFGIQGFQFRLHLGSQDARFSFLSDATGTTELMTILGTGNVGIGTISPQAKLAVNGDIFSKKVKVTQTGWPDYVFHTTYRLRSLFEVEQYIQLFHHLPEVPSAVEIEKNGVDLGDNQAVLLKKIEELTLYVIGLNREVEALKKEISQKQGSN
jgi:hypothetical protein